MASSMMDGVGKAVVGVWRAHTVLDESDGAESSPEAPDRFRKLRSSSSLNSLRMSLRKRLPLRSVQTNSLPENPTWETLKEEPKPSTVRRLTRSARNSITGVYQKLQRTREFSREECLVATQDGHVMGRKLVHQLLAPQDAHLAELQHRDGPPEQQEHLDGHQAPGEGKLLRPVYEGKFDRDLESVSSGLRRLKHLSKAFDDIIGRDDRNKTEGRSGGSVMRKLDPRGKLSRSNLTHRATNLSNTIGGWAHTAVNTIYKPN
ncbi:hypothetical protein INR49_027802 [Caranx melampygus]|nr:hypothetical protein INR49_027802 [Caranx melampygus]